MTISTSSRLPSALYMASIPEGESVKVRPGAMLAARNITIQTQVRNCGIFGTIARLFSTRESLIENEFVAKKGGGWIAFEEDIPGQVCEYSLPKGTSMKLSYGAFVASDAAIRTQDVYAGLFGDLRGIGEAQIEATLPCSAPQDTARIWLKSEAGVVKSLRIRPEDGPIWVDNHNMIGYTSGLDISPQPIGGVGSWVFSGERIVNECRGTGEIFFGSGPSKQKSKD